MKRLGGVVGSLLALLLTMSSMQALAETQAAGHNFDHSTTGFLLVGGHATAACETCHVGGVFKGTPRNCDGCHALGRRIVATPKSTSHLVTDAPCDSCHFNTSTFLGARYNHGTATPGQCTTCHNGRTVTGRPSTHNIGFMLTNSCDNCHRTYSFFPASWNHVGVTPGSCENAGCHLPGTGNRYYRSAAALPLGKTHMNFTLTATQSCDACHNFVRWTPAGHMPVTGLCTTCHDNAQAQGKPAGHLATTDECGQCHFYTVGSWLPALGGFTSPPHIPVPAGIACRNCHSSPGGPAIHGAALHAYLGGVAGGCAACHISPTTPAGISAGQQTRRSHDGSSGSNCTGCHEHTAAAGFARWK